MSAKKIIVPELAHCHIIISINTGNITLSSPSQALVYCDPIVLVINSFKIPILPSKTSRAKNPTIDVLRT